MGTFSIPWDCPDCGCGCECNYYVYTMSLRFLSNGVPYGSDVCYYTKDPPEVGAIYHCATFAPELHGVCVGAGCGTDGGKYCLPSEEAYLYEFGPNGVSLAYLYEKV